MEANKLNRESLLQLVKTMPEEQLAKVISLVQKLNEEEEKKRIEGYQNAIKELHGKYAHIPGSVDDFMRRKQEEKELDR